MRKKNEIIVLRGGPDCGQEFQAGGWLPNVWSIPVTSTALSYDPNPDAHLPIAPTTVDYLRTGIRSASGAHIYDWSGLNWGTWGVMAA